MSSGRGLSGRPPRSRSRNGKRSLGARQTPARRRAKPLRLTHTAGPEHSTARALGAHGSHTTRAKRDISTTRSSYANQNLRKARTRSSCGGRRRPTNDRHLEVAIASAVRLRDSRRSAARHDDASRSPRSRPQSRPPVPAGRATALDAAIGGCRVESEVTWQRAWERSYRRYLRLYAGVIRP